MTPTRFAGGLRVLAFIVGVSVPQAGCGFLFSHGPPAGHEQMEYFTCTEGNTAPIIDVIWGSLNLVTALIIAAEPSSYYWYYDDTDAAIGSSLVWTAVSAAAAGVGFQKSSKCRAAKKLWAERRGAQPSAPQPPGQPGVQAVVLRPQADTLTVGRQVQLVATAHESSGATVQVSGYAWSSSNDAIASVSNAGLVTAHAPGSVVIAANAGNVVGTASVVVTPR